MSERRPTEGSGRAIRIVESAAGVERIEAATAFLTALPAATEALVIAAYREAADDLVRRVTASAGASFGIHRASLLQLAARIAAPELARLGVAPASMLGTEALAARITFEALGTEALGYFGPVARFPGFARALASTLTELRLGRVLPERLEQLGRAHAAGSDVRALLRRFEAALRTGALADRAALFELAAKALSDDAPESVARVPLVLLDVPIVTAAERAFVSRLIEHAPSVLVTVPAGDERTLAALAAIDAPLERPDRDARAPAPAPRGAPAGASALGHLRSYLFAEIAPRESARDGKAEFFSAPGEGRETVEIARRVLEEARRGTPFDQMAVLLRAPHVYATLLETALTRAGIPAFFARGAQRPDPAGRALLVLIDCAIDKLSARRFAEYLSLGQVPPLDADGAPRGQATWVSADEEALTLGADAPDGQGIEGTASDEIGDDSDASPVLEGTLRAPWKWEQLLVDSAVIGGHERWSRRLTGLAAEMRVKVDEIRQEDADSPRVAALERDGANLAHLARFALPVVERLAALPTSATWGQWIAELESLVPMVLRRPERVLAVLAELRPLGPIGPVALDEVRDVLADELAMVAERPPSARYGRVFVGTLEHARGRVFDVVFVPGLAERIFPQRPREDPILLDALRSELDSGLMTQNDRGQHERLLLRLAVGAATRQVYLSYSRIELAEARPRVPSFYAMEIQRALAGSIPDPQSLERAAAAVAGARLAWPAPDDPARAIDPVEHDLASLAALIHGRIAPARGRARYLLELNDRLARSLRSRWARWRKRFTPYDGIVQIAPGTRNMLLASRPTARAYSVSALQRFAACPYQFYLSAIWRLAPREEIAPLQRLDPLTRGSMFHQVQAECLRALQHEGRLPLSRDTLGPALGVLEDALTRVADEYREKLAPAIVRVWQDEVASLRVDLRTWLEKSVEAQAQWNPFAFELAFGLPGGPGVDERSIREEVVLAGGWRLRGIVDLVERKPDESGLRVTDHKTGLVRTAPGVVVGKGEALQPVLYGLAVEKIFGKPVIESRLAYCTRAGEFSERVVPMTEPARRRGLEVLEVIDRAIGQGFLPPAPRERACSMCDFRPVCGPLEERRVREKDQQALAELMLLRELAVTPLIDQEARTRIRTSLDESMVVEAAAGTGKTSELVARLVEVLAEGRGRADTVVAVTFTEKAAGELKLRLRAELENARQRAGEGSPRRARLDEVVAHLEEARVSTIHGFCNDLLHERPVEARVDPRFRVLAEPEAEALYRRAFDRWVEHELERPPEGLRRALRRRASLDDGDPVERLRRAGWTLADWRDFRAPWRREDFARDEAIDQLVERVHVFAGLVRGCGNPTDGLYADTWLARRISDDVRVSEPLAPRDHDGLEANLVDLARSRQFTRTRKGFDRNYRAVSRDEVLAAHGRLCEELDEFAKRADADLAALLQQELLATVDAYEAHKSRAGCLDFLDLLVRTRDLVRDRADVREDLQRRFTHIFVDEFQDTDPLQAEILLLLSSADPAVARWRDVTPLPGKLFVVGDPKQSIYRFRRADVGIYQDVKKLLRERGAAVLDLTSSFRAVPSVQRLLNVAFAPRMVDDSATLQASYVPLAPYRPERESQPSVVALPVPRPYGRWGLTKTAIDQSLPDAAAAFVHWLLKESGWRVTERDRPGEELSVAARHVCLLFRRFTQWGTDITQRYVEALEARGIPHMLVGGKSFHLREEVETLRTALAAIEWPDDELAVYGTLHGPLFAVGDEALLEYRDRIGRLHPFRVREPGSGETMGPHLTAVADALRLLGELHRRRNYRPVEETVAVLLAATRAHAAFILRPSGERALANVLRIAELARSFEAQGGISFRGFVEQLTEEGGSEAPEAPVVEEGSEGVRIMTVHRAKGLEFPVVILADISANAAAQNPGRYIDSERGLCAVRLSGWSPWDLLDHGEEEMARDRAEGVRVAYVAATRARDLLVVPAVGDDPFANGWAAAGDGWIEPVQRAIYPPAETRRASKPARACPTFGEDSVLQRPDRETPGKDNVQPGLYVLGPGDSEHAVRDYSVVWWDPRVLALDAQPITGIPRQDLIEDPGPEVLEADHRQYAQWQRAKDEAIDLGARPSFAIQTVTEWAAQRTSSDEQVPVPDVTVVDAASSVPRPVGPRFGTLVHAVLATVALDAERDAVAEVATMQGRILGATLEEVAAAVALVQAALAHPLLARAREAWRSGRCRRETPVTVVEPDGSILEGVLDLAFEDDDGWTVVDFKTQAELTGPLARHRRQVGAYASVVARVTGRPATAVLMRL